MRRDRALAIIVLSIDIILYLIDEPEDPVIMWRKLSDHFQKKTWTNRLDSRRKLYSLHLNEGESVQQHIKRMTENFGELSVIDDLITEGDRVVHSLASLPDSFSTRAIALENRHQRWKLLLNTYCMKN